jgi:hypothetical protein
MLYKSLNKHRRRAIAVMFCWLFTTFFSCATLSSFETSTADDQSMMMSVQQHHAMAASAGDSTEMPCCAHMELEQVCCDGLVVVHTAYFGTQELQFEKPDTPILTAFPLRDDQYCPMPLSAIPDELDQGFLPSYPRLHVIHCSFQI